MNTQTTQSSFSNPINRTSRAQKPNASTVRGSREVNTNFESSLISGYSLKLFRRIYIVLAIGAVMEFFGHGMWAVRGKEMMVQLVTNSFNNTLGFDLGITAATYMVKSIGFFDVAISMIMAIAVFGFVRGSGRLYRLAFSRPVIALYAWGAFWGLLTAASRITAAGSLFPDVLNLIERGPNFLLPTTVFLLTIHLRRNEMRNRDERLARSTDLTLIVQPRFSTATAGGQL